MHFGLFSLMAQRDRAVSPGSFIEEMVEQVKMAEQIGFDIAWFAEHHFSNYCLCPSPLAMAIALAPQTTTIRLGTAVIVAPLYHPLRMLEEIGMLDVVSNGRAVIGLGTGYQQYEFHRFGISLETARDTFLETLDVLEQYLSGGPVRYDGKAIHIPETYFVVHPIQRRPDIYVAGLARDPETQGARRRAWLCADIHHRLEHRRADGGDARPGDRRESKHAEGDKLRAPYAMQRYVFVTDDKAEALRPRRPRAISAASRCRCGTMWRGWMARSCRRCRHPTNRRWRISPAGMIVGDAETCAEKLAAEMSALQPVHVSCFMGLPGMPQASYAAVNGDVRQATSCRAGSAVGGLARVGHAA